MFVNFRVHGLNRKPRNGAPFYIQRKDIADAPKGFAVVVNRSKDGLFTARLDNSGTVFTFHTKDKESWPHAK